MTETEQVPQLQVEREEDILHIFFSGSWKLREMQPDIAQALREAEAEAGEAKQLCLCGKGIEDWDTSILPYLHAFDSFAEEKKLGIDFGKMPEGIKELFDLSRAAPETIDEKRHEEKSDPFYLIGECTLRMRKDVDAWFEFIGNISSGIINMITGKSKVRRRDFFLIMEDVGACAFPIVTLISFLVGLIITFLGIVVLARFSAEYYVSYLVGYGMLREMGALMTAIILSGRTGSAFAAQIGSMKVNEEIDALRAIGINPVEFLVLPRILALLLMMPLLTIYANVIGIVSGAMVASQMQDIAIPIFAQGLKEAVGLPDFYLGLIKSLVFGTIIALSGCLRGLQCGGDSSAVGRAATSAMVTSVTLIVAFNALIDWISALYGV